MTINFSTPADGEKSISVFETTIGYLGGLLAAYDLSGDERLLEKSIELGDLLYCAFDTPNRMPITHFEWRLARSERVKQDADSQALLADLTGDPKWYDAIAKISDILNRDQMRTNMPGLWPWLVDAQYQNSHSGAEFSVGAMSDSAYEYLPKMHLLLGGSKQYKQMYQRSADAIIENALFCPMTMDEADILIAGKLRAFDEDPVVLRPDGEHLACFVGGMLALGGRLLGNETHVEIGRKLTNGCIWTYQALPLGIMPEDFSMVPCDNWTSCPWSESAWHDAVQERANPLYTAPQWEYQKAIISRQNVAETRLVTNQATLSDDLDTKAVVGPEIDLLSSQRLAKVNPLHVIGYQKSPPGFTSMSNRHYILRPEVIESVFILYRITGDSTLQDAAWRSFESIMNATATPFANAALFDVADPTAPKMDEMESFWLAETLKYFYLIFSEPDLVSLDKYVL